MRLWEVIEKLKTIKPRDLDQAGPRKSRQNENVRSVMKIEGCEAKTSGFLPKVDHESHNKMEMWKMLKKTEGYKAKRPGVLTNLE